MSAPVLSPAEQAEVDRFGVHDADVIADLERMSDESPGCDSCDAAATVAIRMVCCGDSGLACDRCLASLRSDLAESKHRRFCGVCGHKFGVVRRPSEVITVVPL